MSRDEDLKQQAREAFADHVIRSADEDSGRWILQRRYKDGKGWDCVYWTEVVSLAGGMLYVGGDIDFVIFSYYSGKGEDVHRAKVHWMGSHTDFGYYVHQKACIGTGHQLIDVYDENAARAAVQGWLDDKEGGELSEEQEAAIKELLEDSFADWSDQRSISEAIAEHLGWDWVYDMSPIGIVIAARLYFAHAALQRLCTLWDEEDLRALGRKRLHPRGAVDGEDTP